MKLLSLFIMPLHRYCVRAIDELENDYSGYLYQVKEEFLRRVSGRAYDLDARRRGRLENTKNPG